VFDTGTLDELGLDTGLTKERVRQITKRAAKTMSDLVASNSKFDVMAEYKVAAAAAAKPRKASAAPAPTATLIEVLPELLPNPALPHNRLTSLVAIRPEQEQEQEQAASHGDYASEVRKAA
jgi:hypothetical protein